MGGYACVRDWTRGQKAGMTLGQVLGGTQDETVIWETLGGPWQVAGATEETSRGCGKGTEAPWDT